MLAMSARPGSRRREEGMRMNMETLVSERFLDDANQQLEELHRDVYCLTHATRAQSAMPERSKPREIMHKRLLADLQDESTITRYDIIANGSSAHALAVKPRETLIERLFEEASLLMYALRQGRSIVQDLDEEMRKVNECIQERRPLVDDDPAMHMSSCARKKRLEVVVLDNRNDKSRIRMNITQSKNKKLKYVAISNGSGIAARTGHWRIGWRSQW